MFGRRKTDELPERVTRLFPREAAAPAAQPSAPMVRAPAWLPPPKPVAAPVSVPRLEVPAPAQPVAPLAPAPQVEAPAPARADRDTGAVGCAASGGEARARLGCDQRRPGAAARGAHARGGGGAGARQARHPADDPCPVRLGPGAAHPTRPACRRDQGDGAPDGRRHLARRPGAARPGDVPDQRRAGGTAADRAASAPSGPCAAPCPGRSDGRPRAREAARRLDRRGGQAPGAAAPSGAYRRPDGGLAAARRARVADRRDRGRDPGRTAHPAERSRASRPGHDADQRHAGAGAAGAAARRRDRDRHHGQRPEAGLCRAQGQAGGDQRAVPRRCARDERRHAHRHPGRKAHRRVRRRSSTRG